MVSLFRYQCSINAFNSIGEKLLFDIVYQNDENQARLNVKLKAGRRREYFLEKEHQCSVEIDR